MSELYEGQTQVEDLRDLSYVGVDPLDVIEGTMLSITIDGFDPATAGWLPCDGSRQEASTYPFLFASIGYEYTLDNDRINNPDYFNLPDRYTYFIKYIPMTNPFVLESIQAIKNVIKMELLSEPGDYNRNIGKGGILFTFIKKPMDIMHEGIIKDMVASILDQYGNIITHNIEVTRDLITKTWKIYIAYSDTLNKYSTITQIGIQG